MLNKFLSGTLFVATILMLCTAISLTHVSGSFTITFGNPTIESAPISVLASMVDKQARLRK